jgi:hypothetical protein
MKNLVSLSLYVWLVQMLMRKMKEEQEEEDNQRFFGYLRDQSNDGGILLDCPFMSGWVQVVMRKMKE